MNAMHALDEELRQESGGDVGFKFYPNMSMGDEKDVLRKIRLGQINAAGFTGFGLGEITPQIRILELPYLFRSEAEIDYVTSVLADNFSKVLSDKDFILLGWADVGWIYFLSNEPVAEPKHLKDLKVWMWEGDPLARAFFEELNKKPIPLSIADVHLSLQTGLINAVYCSPLAALALQWFTKVKYISDIPFTNAVGAVLLDKKIFNKLSPNHQELLLKLSEKHLRALLVQSRKDNDTSFNELLLEGIKSIKSTPEQRQLMLDIGLRVQERLAGELYPRELLELLRAELRSYREKPSP